MIYLIGAMLLYAVAITLAAVGSRHANPNLVGAITNVVGAVIPIGVVIAEAIRRPLAHDRLGLAAAVGGGIAIAFFVMAFNKSLVTTKVGIASPVVFGGAIVLSAVAGWVFLGERVTPLQGVGLGLVVAGLIVVAYAKAATP